MSLVWPRWSCKRGLSPRKPASRSFRLAAIGGQARLNDPVVVVIDAEFFARIAPVTLLAASYGDSNQVGLNKECESDCFILDVEGTNESMIQQRLKVQYGGKDAPKINERTNQAIAAQCGRQSGASRVFASKSCTHVMRPKGHVAECRRIDSSPPVL
jgi:hypothetical protein